MARIVDYREIPLDDLVIGKGQARTGGLGAGIDELAESIKVQGLLQPIVVCEARKPGKWEILTGQRRYLAHKKLQRDKITAAVLDTRVNEGEAKAISITENLLRRRLSGKQLKDGVLYLYNTYATIKDVVEATGLPRELVRDCIKYPRLIPELKALVDDQNVDINAALKAQDAAEDESGVPDVEVAVKLAQDMQTMSGVQRKKVLEARKENPKKPIDDVIEEAKTGGKVIQIIATVTRETHHAIQSVAAEEKVPQDEAVAGLIEEALIDRGLLE